MNHQAAHSDPGNSQKRTGGVLACLLLVFACFTLTSTAWIEWLHRLTELAPPGHADIIALGGGYLLQALGIGGMTLWEKLRPRSQNRQVFIGIIAAHFLCALFAASSSRLATTIVFGCLVSVTCGMIAALYLGRLVRCVPVGRRGTVFGAGYASSIVVTWLLSLVSDPASTPSAVAVVACTAFSAIAILVLIREGVRSSTLRQVKAAAQTAPSPDPAHSQQVQPNSHANGKLIALAGTFVLLVSLVKNLGLQFPSTNVQVDMGIELSRLFYAAGLLAAGFLVDRSRKAGLICCVATLITPFALMVLSGDYTPDVVLWGIDFLLFGFYAVFRVVVFTDIAADTRLMYLAGLGLMLGRVGDAVGNALALTLGGTATAPVVLAAVAFVASVIISFLLFTRLFSSQGIPIGQRTNDPELERAIAFERFCTRYELSSREREVLQHLIDGKTNSEIASVLFVSESTVKFHVHNLLKKTACKSRLELRERYVSEL